MSDWIDEDLAETKTLTLESGGVRVARSLAPWTSVLGALALPAGAPKQLFVLVPRRPPAPPWFAVTAEQPPAEPRRRWAKWLSDLESLQGES